MQWVPNSTMVNVSASPPLIPDGRLSRVRLAAMAFPSRTFPFKPKLKCLPTYAPCLNGLISNSTFLLVCTILQHSVWSVFLSNARHLPRAPLPAQGVTSYGVMSMHDIRERYPSFTAHTGSCVRPKPSCRLGLNLVRHVFVDCCKSLLGRWPFPTLSLQSLRRCLDPYPAVSFQCTCPLLPGRQRPHLKRDRFGTPKMLPAMQLQQGHASRGCSHSVMFRLPRSLDPQVAPTAEILRAAGPFTPRIAW
jgi:hypothetical protein